MIYVNSLILLPSLSVTDKHLKYFFKAQSKKQQLIKTKQVCCVCAEAEGDVSLILANS